jgi:hypothetical protein
LRLRPLTRADLPGLESLLERRLTRQVEALASPEILAALIDSTPQAQVLVELDQEIVGALVAAQTAWRPQTVVQPWDRLVGEAPGLEFEPADALLRGCGAFWREDLSAEVIAEVLTVGRKAVVQQLGLDGVASVVEVAGWSKWRSQMGPEAYLQQVHAGGFGDSAVRLLLENGWVMRGFWERGESLEVVMWWGNRVR